MAVLSRRSFNVIEILRVNSNPNGTSAETGSLAKDVVSGVVWKNVGGTSWEVLNSGTLAPLTGPAGSPVGASYVVLGSDGTLTSERVLTAGSGISITDGGAGGNLTIAATGGGGGGSGALTLIESKYISSNTQSIVFSGLDGDADGFYQLIGRRLAGSSAACTYEIRPNESSSNLYSVYHILASNGGTVTHAVGNYASVFYWGSGVSAGSYGDMKMTFCAKTGVQRWFELKTTYSHSSATYNMLDVCGRLNDTSTNITSLEIRGSIADSFISGSEFHLYKFGRNAE